MFFKKQLRIDALNAENRDLASDLAWYKDEYHKMKAQLRGGRVRSSYCEKCEHGVQQRVDAMGLGSYKVIWDCALECKCKDFKKKECAEK